MNRGMLQAALAYIAWGLFPLYFRELEGVGAFEIVLHRVAWSLAFLALILLWLRRWQWIATLRFQPMVLGMFALSSLVLAVNWLTYVWAVSNGHVIDASLGYFINPLVSVALGYFVLHERLRRWQWVAVALAAAGVLWLAALGSSVPWVGVVIAVSFGLYGLMRKTAALGALEGLTLETLLLAGPALGFLLYQEASGVGAFGQLEFGEAGGVAIEDAGVGFEMLGATYDAAEVGRWRCGVALAVEGEEGVGQAAEIDAGALAEFDPVGMGENLGRGRREVVTPIAGVAEGEDRAGVLVGAGGDDAERGGRAQLLANRTEVTADGVRAGLDPEDGFGAGDEGEERGERIGWELVQHVADDEQADWLGGGE